MSVVEEPNGKPQIFSKWGHKEFLVIRGICFFSPNQIFPFWLLHFFGSDGKELLAIYLAIVAVIVIVVVVSSVPLFPLSITDSLTDSLTL